MSTLDPEAATPSPAPDDVPQTNLLLDSLEIKNFRAFRHLTIPKLGRVNLITGKNNVGKSSVLEAVWLYADRGSPLVVLRILKNRRETREASFANPPVRSLTDSQLAEDNTFDFRFLLSGRPSIDNSLNSLIEVGPTTKEGNETMRIGMGCIDSKASFVSSNLNFKNFESILVNPNKRMSLTLAGTNALFVFIGGSEPDIYDLSQVMNPRNLRRTKLKTENAYVDSNGLTDVLLSEMWDQISLTDLEVGVVEALKIIYPAVDRINFKNSGESLTPRSPFVKTSNYNEPIPLRSLGEGINRLLSIILSIVNARNGVLLVDEIENGLHYSALPDVWRLIFQTAKRLNVQVFATTHSWDCIEAFQQSASEDDDPNSGVLVRLQNNDSGDVTATVFDEEDLAIVTRSGIEVRLLRETRTFSTRAAKLWIVSAPSNAKSG